MDPDPVSLTRKLISFNTMNPPGFERDCAEFLGELLEGGGYEVSYYEFEEGRTSLVARREGTGDKPPICFSGHLDTVPLGAAEWGVDPFAGEIVEGRLYGRGSSDMKGGVAAIVSAALTLPRKDKGRAGVTLVLTAGEEKGCEGASYMAGLRNALGEAGALIVGEPTSNYPVIGHKGVIGIEMETMGIAAHGSMPEQGDNAIYKAAEAVLKLRDYRFDIPPDPLLGSPTINVGTIRGGININSVPDRAVAGIDIRTIPGQGNGKILEGLQAYLGREAKLKCLLKAQSIFSDPEDEWVQEVFSICGSFLNEEIEPRGVSYFTDASVLKPALGDPPTVILGPGEPSMAHKSDEFCYVESIRRAAEMYLEIARNWCSL
ncbi:MAG: M20 family metallopeptidase [Deltaproteobacteria bacterium]|nr:M20 family metallopeptidase [Deltaproteobacteria bacterium]